MQVKFSLVIKIFFYKMNKNFLFARTSNWPSILTVVLIHEMYFKLFSNVFQIWRSQIGPPNSATNIFSDPNSKMKPIYSERAKNLRSL